MSKPKKQSAEEMEYQLNILEMCYEKHSLAWNALTAIRAHIAWLESGVKYECKFTLYGPTSAQEYSMILNFDDCPCFNNDLPLSGMEFDQLGGASADGKKAEIIVRIEEWRP